MRISVVVPLYNKARYLGRTLTSISAQSHGDFEIIIVDDGSTDDSLAVARRHQDPRLRILSQDNAGPGAARNRGLKEASGDYIAFLDADDEWEVDFLEHSIARLATAPDAASVSSGYIEMPGGHSTEPMWRQRGLSDGVFQISADMPPRLMLALLAYMTPCSTLFRTEVVRQLGGFYDRNRCLFGEDAYLCAKILFNHPVLIDLTPRIRIHRDASGLSSNLRKMRPIEPFLEDIAGVEEACPEHLRPTLWRLLAARAFKTACVLGYWGEWQRAKVLRDRFHHVDASGIPYRMTSLFCTTPFVKPVSGAARLFWRP